MQWEKKIINVQNDELYWYKKYTNIVNLVPKQGGLAEVPLGNPSYPKISLEVNSLCAAKGFANHSILFIDTF